MFWTGRWLCGGEEEGREQQASEIILHIDGVGQVRQRRIRVLLNGRNRSGCDNQQEWDYGSHRNGRVDVYVYILS